jgi:toxin-antitoxin system PIN domain toxin
MGFLRLLTNRSVMSDKVMTQAEAWAIYAETMRDGRTFFAPEPNGFEARWRALTVRTTPSHKLWTDCYLAAFAELHDMTVVTFDKTFAGSHRGALILS